MASSNQDLYNLRLLAKSLESMLLLWEQHVNALPADDSEPTSRLRSTAKDARSSVANIVEVSQMLTPDHDGQFPAFKSQGAELAHRLPIDEFSAAPRASVSVAAFHEDEASLHKSKSVILDSPPSLELEEEELAVVEEDTPRGPSWLSKYVIFPGWTSKLIWDLAVMTIVLMDAFVLPVQLSFKRDYGEDAFDDAWFWVTTLCFSADILVTFDTGLTVAGDDQDIITDHGIIARAYLRGWFSLDFLSTMPWSCMVDAAVGSDEGGGALLHVAKLAKMLKFLRIIRLMKMLRAKKIRDIWERVEIRIGSVTVIQAMYLVRVLLVIVAICHWNACIFWMVGRPDSIITDFMPTETRETFEKLPHWTTILHTYGKYQVASMGNAAYDVVEEEWTYAQKPFSDVYIFCFYWTLGVMRTMPSEVQPVNLAERTFVLCFMFFALSAFAVSVASLTQTYFKISERNRGFRDEMFALRMHMHKLKLDDVSQRKIKDYITHLFTNRRIMAKELNFLKQLPDPLSVEVRYAEVLQFVSKLHLPDVNKEDIRRICLEGAESMDLLADQTLCVAGQEARSAWIVVAGHVTAQDINKKQRELIGHPIIIDEACLEKGEPVLSQLTVVTASTCSLIRIGKLTFASIVGMHLSSKRKDVLALSERPDQIEILSNTVSGNTQPANAAGAGAAAAAVMSA